MQPTQASIENLRKLFVQGHVVYANQGSGKTSAIFQAADEFARSCSCRIAIVAPSRDLLMAEAVRIRLRNAVPNQFARLDFFGESEIGDLKGTVPEVMVDDWFQLSEQSKEFLSKNFRILAAVGTDPSGTHKHGEQIRIK